MPASPAAVAFWKRQAGSGDVDERCARISAELRKRMGIVMPGCVWCDWPMVLVRSRQGSRYVDTWVHEASRVACCFPDEPDLADELGEVAA